MTKGKRLVAYMVEDRSEGGAVIVFARGNAAARREGSCEMSVGDFHSVTARRAQWADAYADAGCVPPLVMIDRGWRFDCTGCERQVSDDANDYLDEGEPEIVPYVRRGNVFCRRRCCASHTLERRIERKIKAAAAAWWISDLIAKYPGVAVTDSKIHIYAAHDDRGWCIRYAGVGFVFPGSKHGDAGYYLRDDYAAKKLTVQVAVPAGDLLAWHIWRGDDLDKVEWPKWFPRPVAP